MIYLSDKLSIINNKGVPQNANLNKSLISKNYVGQDTISFSGTQETHNKKEYKNKLTTYIIAGLVIVGGVILALKFKKGKKSSDNIVENIPSKEPHPQHKGASLNSSQATVQSTSKEKVGLEKQIEQLDVEIQQAKKELQKFIDDLIAKIKPNDKETAKAALPQLINHSKELGIGIEDFNSYLMYLTTENKDFAIKEGIPLIANNIELIKKAIPNSEYSDIPKLLKCINSKNKDELKSLLENPKENGIESIITLGRKLLSISSRNNK